MSFEPRRCIGRTVVYGIVQEALPFEESKVPGKVPDPKSCGTCPSTRENSLTSLGRPFFVVVAIFVFWMVQDSFGYNPSDSICAAYLHAWREIEKDSRYDEICCCRPICTPKRSLHPVAATSPAVLRAMAVKRPP